MESAKSVMYVLGVLGLLVIVGQFIRTRRAMRDALVGGDCPLCEGKMTLAADGRERCAGCGGDGRGEDDPRLAPLVQSLRDLGAARRSIAEARDSFDGGEYNEANLRLAETVGHLRDLMRTHAALGAEAIAVLPNADATTGRTGLELTLNAAELHPILGALTGLGMLVKAAADGTLGAAPDDFRRQLITWDTSLLQLRATLVILLNAARQTLAGPP